MTIVTFLMPRFMTVHCLEPYGLRIKAYRYVCSFYLLCMLDLLSVLEPSEYTFWRLTGSRFTKSVSEVILDSK